MGIKGLSKVIAENAPGAVKEQKLEAYFDRKIAIDASMQIYQFLIAIRQGAEQLTNEAGDVTSHLQGLFSRTIRLMEKGVKPVYVFDGKPPTMKSGELAKRQARNQEAKDSLAKAEETGNAEDIEKFSKRTVRASREQSDECKRLLTLMGLPVVEAPCEAEAQCAELVKGNVCFATATEDMDALTFATTRLVRNFTQPESRKLPILEYNHADMLEGLKMTQTQFIDLCILLGCDYCDSIRGVGPVKAIDLMRKAKDEGIERIVKDLDPKKYTIPDVFPFEDARVLFNAPDVTPSADVEAALVWKEPDCAGLKAFLVDEKGFQAERVDSAIARLVKTKTGGRQQRMENFFTVKTVIKRKIVEMPSGKNKKGKGAAGAFKKKK